jgi:Tol biopolymer transport system component/tRNA A-37 threonylcarbamoyl transferase component Bud32
MPLSTGTRVGPYEILSPIGAGGMGEVYRARDSKLHRDVAVKVLPQIFTADADRLARFRREAQVLASLNHQNIGHIYGLEDSGTTHGLILELVEGPTLGDRIAQGALPHDEAFSIARQIIDALECAHEQGIVHRDLKPANIKIRPDGAVKVLDFGLAKALERPAASGVQMSALNSPTMTAHATVEGMIVGTAAYMAPEQARGRAVDRRADIWAFGIVLYEMLAGKRAFDGDDVSITLASVLKDDVDWKALPADLPPSIRRMLRRCLEKDPRRRLSAIGDARLELDDASEPLAVEPVTAHGVIPRTRPIVPWAIAALTLVTLFGTVVLWAPWKRPPIDLPMRLSADIGVAGPLAVNMGAAAVISPDGSVAVFVVQTGTRNLLYVRRIDSLEATALNGTDDAHSPFFSPDSQWIGFFSVDKLKKIAVGGGTTVNLCEAPNGRGGSWGTDGTIVFQPSASAQAVLHQVADTGGTSVPIGKPFEDQATQRWPQHLPNGKAVLYSANSATVGWDSGTLMALPRPGGEPKVLMRGAFYGRYAPSGHLLYVRGSTLFAVPFDAESLQVRGRETPLVEGVLAAANTGGAQFSLSDSGTLLYVPGKAIDPTLSVSWIDKTGRTSVLRAEPTNWSQPSFSPDGQRLAMTIGFGISSDVWLYDWSRDATTQLTFGSGGDSAPVWTPDGTRIAYSSSTGNNQATNLFWKRADGVGEGQRLTDSPNPQTPFSFHQSGGYLHLAYVERRSGNADLMILPLKGDEKGGWKAGTATTFLATPAVENSPMFSPDGRWLAYSSTESGAPEIWVRAFGSGESKWKISTGRGGLQPVWSRKRNELFYMEPLGGQWAIMVAEYRVDGESFRAERPRRWYPSLITAARPVRPYDVHPDGDRIAVAIPPDLAGPQAKPVFVFNLFDELRQKVK